MDSNFRMFISKIMKSEWSAWVPRTSQANVMEIKTKKLINSVFTLYS